MKRRDALKLIGAGTGLVTLPALAVGASRLVDYGAIRPRNPRPDVKTFHKTFRPFRGVSGAINQNVFLYQNLQKQIGEIVPHNQATIIDSDGNTLREGEGDCVGHATAMGCDVLAATNIHMLGLPERWEAKASVEMIYAGSRVEIGQQSDDNLEKVNWLAGRGGSHGEWAARYVKQYGVLHRRKYQADGNEIDLTGYEPDRSRQYRDVGVPDWLEPIARQHPVREVTNVQTGREALDAVCAGQPVLMCSSYAFRDTRDADGFASAYLGTSRRGWLNAVRIQWWHAMILTGAILTGNRIGGVLQNSHGVWNSGPRPNDMPEGSFAVDLSTLDLMVRDWFDCYALSSYVGHQALAIRHKLYW